MIHVLEREQLVKRPLAEVFEFFSNAENLERLTPPQLRFRILTPLPIEMKAGAEIDYQLQLFGVPFKWKTLIETFTPQSSFVDRQLRGPYKLWHHTHAFSAVPNGTMMRDTVRYEIPLGPLGELARLLFVQRQVAWIFDYRMTTIDALLPERPS
jgi:ligand-binding SRPBCC domain-containing protein